MNRTTKSTVSLLIVFLLLFIMTSMSFAHNDLIAQLSKEAEEVNINGNTTPDTFVTLLITRTIDGDKMYADQTRSDEEGNYSFEFELEEGTYEAIVTSNCIQKEISFTVESSGNSGQANHNPNVTVYMRIEGYNETIVPKTKVTTNIFNLNPYLGPASGSTAGQSAGWDVDKFSKPTVAHALVKLLDTKDLDYDLQDYGWGLYLAMLDGEREFDIKSTSGWLYRVNDNMPSIGCQGYELDGGENIVWYFGVPGFDTWYSKLQASKTRINTGEEVLLTLTGLKTDLSEESGSGSEQQRPLEEAIIYINGEEQDITTDDNGQVKLTFNSSGSYKIWAERYTCDKDGLEYKDMVRPEPVTITVKGSTVDGPSIMVNPGMSDDETIIDNINKTGEAKISLDGKKDSKAVLSVETIKEINENKPLIIENKSIQVELPAKSLFTEDFTKLTEDKDAKLELSVKEIDNTEKQEILNKVVLGEKTGVFDIGGKIFDITAEITRKDSNETEVKTKINSFNNPVKSTIDLSDMNLSKEEIKDLCAVRYVTDEWGNVTVIKLGGTYDPETKQYTFYTDSFSYYGILKVNDLIKIRLGVNKLTVQVNDEKKYLDVPAMIINNRTMVPIRFVAENMGANVEWVESTRTVIIEQGSIKMELPIDLPYPGLDTPPTIQNGRTLVPIRYVAENLGAYVMWHSKDYMVDIIK